MPKPEQTDQERLSEISAKVAQANALREQADELEEEARKLAAEARQAGLLTKDLIEVTGWSHQKMARVLRMAGVTADRSAPRKRRV
ncbi:hypothetical protein [Amycolatopsis anabasis]|uniref:hypothetical protein n=1 Tax=Amycolatopsis anabasis TaxID=1840409 RepID=UPI00131B80A7|nr:hypothetical protein [Amycolatopsis anabasis]